MDNSGILRGFEGLAAKLETGSHHVSTTDRETNIKIVLGLIRDFFVHKEPPLLGHGAGLIVDFENSLRRSIIETPRYEFKQGLCRLDAARKRDSDLIPRIIETACGIANIGRNSTGYIYLGVADKERDADRIRQLDQITPVLVAQTWVVGIDREAKIQSISVEHYVRNFISELRLSDHSEPLKSSMLSAIDTITYRGLAVIRLTVPAQQSISWIGDRTFTREGSETKESQGKMIASITSRFSLR
jgi:hypothetical protein